MASNAAEVELGIDLSPFRQGIRKAARLVRDGLGDQVLTPFQKGARRVLHNVRGMFEKFAGGMKALLSTSLGPILALAGVSAVIGGIKSAIDRSLEAFRAYGDSVTILTAALETIEGIDLSGTLSEVDRLGDRLRLSLGIGNAETNNAFANFVTRGFDLAQAEQLTVLAANYAKKAGKPLADVQKQIADAANGSVDAIKELGLEMAVTGDRVADAEKAVLLLKGSYGDIGTQLVNPSERLSAAWDQVFVVLGERIGPILEPLIQNVSDFVTGLSESEEGRQILDGIAAVLETIIGLVGGLLKRMALTADFFFSSGRAIIDLVKLIVAKVVDIVVSTVRKIPGGDWLLEKMGFDPEGAAQIAKEMAEESMSAYSESMKGFEESGMRMGKQALHDLTGGAFGEDATGQSGLAAVMEQGAAIRARATQELNAQMAATQNDTFAGQAARDDNARKEAEAKAKAEEALAKKQEASRKQLAKNAMAYGEAGDGQRVSVTIKSRRPDRFKKVRTV